VKSYCNDDLTSSYSSKFPQQLLPPTLLMLIVFSYSIISFNKYLPVQEGWFQFYHMLMDEGKFPYRDFYIPIQPVFVLLTDLLNTLFGTSFIVLRWYGVIERVILILLVFIYLRKQYDGVQVFFLTLVGFFLYSSFNVDLPYSYYQTTLLFSFLGVYFLCNGIVFRKRTMFNVYFGGFWTGLAFFTKQSSGLMLLLITTLALIVQGLRTETKSELLKRTCAYLSGLLTVSAPILIWLYSGKALNSYYVQVFKSSSSKGSPEQIILGFVPRLFEHINIPILLVFSSLLFSILIYHHFFTDLQKVKRNKNRSPEIKIGILFLMILIAFIYPLVSKKLIYGIRFVNYDNMARVIILITFVGVLISFSKSLLKWLKNCDNQRNNFVLLTGLFCFGWMYGHGMSGVLEVHSLLPAFPFLMLLVSQGSDLSNMPLSPEGNKNSFCVRKKKWLPSSRMAFRVAEACTEYRTPGMYRILIFSGMGILFAFVIIIASTRYAIPFCWWGWQEGSIKTAKLSSTIPALHGIKLSPESHTFYSEAYQKIIVNTEAGDDVFFFPHISALNVMTNRKHNNFIPITYFDVCSDEYAEMTAQYLEQSPPKIIILMDFPEEAWKIHENIFRGGKRSGQRKIQNVIENFKQSNRYEIVYSAKIPHNYPVEILRRKDEI